MPLKNNINNNVGIGTELNSVPIIDYVKRE